MFATSPAVPTSGDRLPWVLIPLMKGVLYRENDPLLWQSLLELQGRVRDQVAPLGLELVVDESEGYAYLKQAPNPEVELPRLVPRRPLSFQVSLLIALLRKKLVELDAGGTETRLILSREQIVELVRLFLPDTANEARLLERIDTQINKVVEMGFLRRLRGKESQYEVRRILKAFVDAQWLQELDRRLAEYQSAIVLDPPGAEP